MNISGPVYKTLLRKNSEVAHLITQSRYLLHLTQRLKSVLDTELAPHFQVASLQHSHLVLVTSSAAWATRLRLQAHGLVAILSHQLTEFQGLKSIEVKILPARVPPTPPPQQREISPQAAANLNAMAQALGEGELSAALKRLASRCPSSKTNTKSRADAPPDERESQITGNEPGRKKTPPESQG